MDIKNYFSRLFKDADIEAGTILLNHFHYDTPVDHKKLKDAINFAWLCHAQETIVKIPGGCMTHKHNLVGQSMGRAGFELAVVQILDEIFPDMQVEIPENE
uniref:Uncharacterized protein n=1 Tax=Candidatus Nitrotoga fabula TaxID=2182327 RepID=A0A2X0QVJ2_9PROT|nr:protein of unknown function [Candidatus Nitrotoga fabula]